MVVTLSFATTTCETVSDLIYHSDPNGKAFPSPRFSLLLNSGPGPNAECFWQGKW